MTPTGTAALALCLLLGAEAAPVSEGEALRMQVPPSVAGEPVSEDGKPLEAAERMMGIADGDLIPRELPDKVNAVGESVEIRDNGKTYIFLGGENPVHVTTDEGTEMFADRVVARPEEKTLELTGKVVIFQHESVTRAPRVVYNWETEEVQIRKLRTKVMGMIMEADSVEYGVDERGREYADAIRASVTTEDKEKPSSWVVTKKLRLYPKDKIEFSHMWIQSGGIPIFYFPYFIHSLNPKEGYMLRPGSLSIWGGYVLNEYGILLGNRRIDSHGVPTSDYLAMLHLDYRTRRGGAYGFDLQETELYKKHRDMDGFTFYYADDTHPDINPTDIPRVPVGKDRFRTTLHQMWNLHVDDSTHAKYRLKANVNYLSDRYVLRDFFQDICQVNDRPDNTVVLDRRTPESETSLLVRRGLNDFYMTDSRAELTYDRVRATIGNSRIAYETHNSFGALKQNLGALDRIAIQNQLAQTRPGDTETREYWERLLNTSSFMRFHTFHELTTSFKTANFINLTPKLGGGYSGYYNVEGVGHDNRFMLYAACDADIKFSRSYAGVHNSTFGLNGLNHVIQPYSTFSSGETTDADSMVPRIDAWTNTTNAMPLDIGTLTCIDTFSEWAVWRYGIRNILSTNREGERVEWMAWDVFMDANLKANDTERKFSNLYSRWRWSPVEWYSLNSEVQFPIIQEKSKFREYNNYIQFQPIRSAEFRVAHRYLSDHPLFENSNQLNVKGLFRINENVAVSAEWQWDLIEKRTQIQQYSVYRNVGAWFVGGTLFIRNNGGKRETGIGFSITLGETGDSFPVRFF